MRVVASIHTAFKLGRTRAHQGYGLIGGRWRRLNVFSADLKFEAFLIEDRKDDTHAVLHVVDCACVGNPKCPRTRGFALGADKYESTGIQVRRAKR